MSEEIKNLEEEGMEEITQDQKIDRLEKSIENVTKGIEQLKDKTGKIIFFVSDTEGNARGSIINIYDQAETLISLGYNVTMLYEKKEHAAPSTWGKKSFDDFPRASVQEGDALKVGSGDILVVPEIHGDILQKTGSLPLHRIIFIQSHEYMLDNFQIGKTWTDYGVFDIITPTDTIVDMIKSIGHSDRVHVISPKVDNEFIQLGKSKPIKKPIISVYSRDQRKTMKLIKQFTTKYPMYRWVNFTDAHGTHHESMPELLAESMLLVWNDPISTYGRMALEALHVNTPVVGVLPDIPQEWMNENNGIWVNNDNDIVDIVATYVKQWIEDNLDVLNDVNKTVKGIGNEEVHMNNTKESFESIISKRLEFLTSVKERYEEDLNELKSETVSE